MFLLLVFVCCLFLVLCLVLCVLIVFVFVFCCGVLFSDFCFSLVVFCFLVFGFCFGRANGKGERWERGGRGSASGDEVIFFEPGPGFRTPGSRVWPTTYYQARSNFIIIGKSYGV